MFQSIRYSFNASRYSLSASDAYDYTLIDTDFEVQIIGSRTVLLVVIEEYSKRKLNVAINLLKAFQWYEKEYGYSVEQHIRFAEQNFKRHFTPELKADLQKYLALL